MLDDFFIRAVLAGIGVAVVAGPLGCLIVWRRLAYFGDTLAHSALLGVALGFLLEVNLTLTVFGVAVAVASILLSLQRRTSVSSDALLGLLSHGALAVGLVCLSFMPWVQVDLMGFLFGDILAVSKVDLVSIYAGGLVALAVLAWYWRRLFAATVSPELAEAEGLEPGRANMVFMLLIAIVIAIALKIVGTLLITALLLIPAATARRWAASPEHMAVLAAIVGAGSVMAGLHISRFWDTPSGPSIVVAALAFFVVSLMSMPFLRRQRPARPEEPAA